MTNKEKTTTAPDQGQVVCVRRADLPAYCPTDAMGLWNSHPRVFIPLDDTPQANCPYCGTRFELVEDQAS